MIGLSGNESNFKVAAGQIECLGTKEARQSSVKVNSRKSVVVQSIHDIVCYVWMTFLCIPESQTATGERLT